MDVQHHDPAALPPGKWLCTHRTGGWVGPRGQCGRVRKISPPRGFVPRTVQAIASGYTKWGTPAAPHISITKTAFIQSLLLGRCIDQTAIDKDLAFYVEILPLWHPIRQYYVNFDYVYCILGKRLCRTVPWLLLLMYRVSHTEFEQITIQRDGKEHSQNDNKSTPKHTINPLMPVPFEGFLL